MKIKLIFVLVIAFALFVCVNGVASATIWHIDDDLADYLADYPGANFTKIRAAVDAASPGDTIIVYPGTYTENVDVDKRLTIQSENWDEATIVQAADLNDGIFEVEEVIA